jgi:hypothetical protein
LVDGEITVAASAYAAKTGAGGVLGHFVGIGMPLTTRIVEPRRFELLTSALQRQRSTN